MLHQVRSTGGASADTRGRCRSKGACTLERVHGILLTELQRPEQNEVSLALVPREHPLIPPSRLEPEALGLLDRLLNVFHEETRYVLAM